MDNKRLYERYKDYSNAVSRLKEALAANVDNDFIYDAVIQRFEFTYELSWKLLKAYISYQGIADVNTPREVYKEAFAASIIVDGELWIEMLNDRNLTSHVYDETQAKRIYCRVKDRYFQLFDSLKKRLEREISQ